MRLQVIKGTQKKRPWSDANKQEIYQRIFVDKTEALRNAIEDIEINNDLMKQFVVAGVKYIGSFVHNIDNCDYEQLIALFKNSNAILSGMTFLKPKDIVVLFPASKIYDGDKYSMKDYYSSMEALKKAEKQWRKNVSEDALSFLMDYDNADTRRFCIVLMMTLTRLQRMNGETDFMMQFLQERGVKAYTKQTVNGKDLLFDSEGNFVSVICKPKKRIPSWIHVVK